MEAYGNDIGKLDMAKRKRYAKVESEETEKTASSPVLSQVSTKNSTRRKTQKVLQYRYHITQVAIKLNRW